MVFDPVNVSSGEDRAWKALLSADADYICANASVKFEHSTGIYTVNSFGNDFYVSLSEKAITSSTPAGLKLLGNPEYFFSLSVLWYLTSAINIPLKGTLVRPEHIKNGQIFAVGTHVLPLNDLAEKYASSKDGFMNIGKAYGGVQESYGDASFRLLPFPRIPVVMSLWLADEEFPARADLLFDQTCEQQAPTDVLWSVSMMCVSIML
ncbi:MAG: DUF3786 domain-containing protein [Nitrospirae bacterium]|nr:DUF3786 domain-containing protein [Nitrospirota bacterium]